MSDLAFTIIIVCVIVLSAPAWVPLLYLAGLAIFAFAVAIIGGAFALFVCCAVKIDDYFERRKHS